MGSCLSCSAAGPRACVGQKLRGSSSVMNSRLKIWSFDLGILLLLEFPVSSVHSEASRLHFAEVCCCQQGDTSHQLRGPAGFGRTCTSVCHGLVLAFSAEMLHFQKAMQVPNHWESIGVAYLTYYWIVGDLRVPTTSLFAVWCSV